MSDTDTATPDAFASVTSADVRPGETPAQARTRRKTETNRARRADKPPKPTPTKSAAEPADTPAVPTPPARGPGRPSVKSRRSQATTGVIATVGVAVSVMNADDGKAILEGAPALGDALAELAETNRAVARALDTLSGTSAWAGVALAVYAIAAPIAVNHGMFGLGVQASPTGEPTPAAPAAEPTPDDEPLGFTVAGGARGRPLVEA